MADSDIWRSWSILMSDGGALIGKRAVRTRYAWRFAQLIVLLSIASWVAVPGAMATQRQVSTVVDAVDAREWREAMRRASGRHGPLLLPYVRWRRLLADDDATLHDYRTFLDEHGDWPGTDALQRRAEALLDEQASHDLRLSFFEARPPLTSRGQFYLAEALAARGNGDEAIALARQSWRDGVFSGDEQERLLARFGTSFTLEDHRDRLDRLLSQGAFTQAARMAALVGPDYAKLIRARTRLQRREGGVDAAIDAVPARFRTNPGLVFDRIRWRRQSGLNDGARDLLLTVDREPADAHAWWYERGYQAREAIDERSFALAYRLASTHRQSRGFAFAEAEWLAGWLALRFNGDATRAAAHFGRLDAGVSTPVSKARAAYWLGRAEQARGDAQAALKWFQKAAGFDTTFYGQQAAIELGMAAVRPSAFAAPRKVDFVSRSTDRRVDLALLLCSAGHTEEAGPFVRRIAADAAQQPEQFAIARELAVQCGRPDFIVTIAKRAAGATDDHRLESFPVPDLATFDAARHHGIALAVILAIARQESEFDFAASSPAGALGLVQLLPSTASAMARKHGLSSSRQRLLDDPAHNVRLGAAYLAELLQEFDGDLVLASAGYNAGPGRVREWIRRYGDPRGMDRHARLDWIELIPFAETRNYVQRVAEGIAVYEFILQSGTYVQVPFAPQSDLVERADVLFDKERLPPAGGRDEPSAPTDHAGG